MPVLDSAAIINAKFADGVTVPEVIAELKDFESRELAVAKIAEGTLQVIVPSPASVAAVKKAALHGLSRTDIAVLALALERKDEIITDDYTVQATAKKLGLKFRPAIMPGI